MWGWCCAVVTEGMRTLNESNKITLKNNEKWTKNFFLLNYVIVENLTEK